MHKSQETNFIFLRAKCCVLSFFKLKIVYFLVLDIMGSRRTIPILCSYYYCIVDAWKSLLVIISSFQQALQVILVVCVVSFCPVSTLDKSKSHSIELPNFKRCIRLHICTGANICVFRVTNVQQK